MNILFLAPRLPLPADTGGKIRTLSLLKEIKKFASIHLVCFSFDKNDFLLKEELENQGIQVSLVHLKKHSVLKKILIIVFNSEPHSILKYHSKLMQETIVKFLATENFDLVHFDHLHMSHYRSCFTNIPCVLDEHNVEYKILERCSNVEKSPIKKFFYKNQAVKMKKFETKHIARMTEYFGVSVNDVHLFQSLTNNTPPGYVISNGVDTEHFSPSYNQSNQDSLIFTGSMDWLPNEDAVMYFYDQILPLIWKIKPKVNFYIVGKSPSATIQQLALKEKRIIVTGRVDDVRPFMASADIFVVPIRIGGGTRLKILEAMSMQKAVVSTSTGAEGISCKDGENILLADEPILFAEKVLFLLNNPSQRKILEIEGRKLVCNQYNWSMIGQKLENIYKNHEKPFNDSIDNLPFVSIIIPAFNAQKYIGRCLDSLSKQNYPKNKLEIIVIDNSSTDETVQVSTHYSINLFNLPRGKKISQIRNFGALQAKGDIFAFIDSDCVAPVNWINKAVELINKPNIAAVGCWYKLPPDAVYIEKVWDINSKMRRETAGQTEWLPSSNFIIHKKVFHQINGFDESLITAEDVDISKRVRMLGSALFTHPEIAVIHLDNPKNLKKFLLKEKWRGEGVVQGLVHDFPNIKLNKAIIFTGVSLLLLLGIFVGIEILGTGGNPITLELCVLGILFIPILLAAKAVIATKKWSYFLPLTFLFTVYAIARILSLFNPEIWKKINDKKT